MLSLRSDVKPPAAASLPPTRHLWLKSRSRNCRAQPMLPPPSKRAASMNQFEKDCNHDEACVEKKVTEVQRQLTAEGKLPRVSWERIVDHIDHAVKLAGADHVGLGSDFDGATMPEGMEDCTHLPQITEALMRRGYSDADIQKILGGNVLRVMEQAERVSREMQAEQHGADRQ